MHRLTSQATAHNSPKMAPNGSTAPQVKKVISSGDALKCLAELETDLKSIGRGSTSSSAKDKWAKLTQTIKTYVESTASTSTSTLPSTLTDMTTPVQLMLNDETILAELPGKYLNQTTKLEVLNVSINRVHLIKICEMATEPRTSPPEHSLTELPEANSSQSSVSRFEAMLTSIANDNAKLRQDVLELKSKMTKPSTASRPGYSTRPKKTHPESYAHAAANGLVTQSVLPQTHAGQVLSRAPTRPAKQSLTTIRIKPKDQGNKIDHLLKDKILPDGVDLVKSRLLFDGSKVITTTKEKELRTFLSSIDSIQILDKPSFKPKVKVLYVPTDTCPDDVRTALGATHCRLLRSIDLPKAMHRHLIFEVDSAAYKKLVGCTIFLPGLTACQVIKCQDVPICGHCLRPGHNASRCRFKDVIPTPLCSRCGESGHDSKGCQATRSCINCHRAKRPDKDHSAFDQRRCPELKRHAEWKAKHTDYGQ